jgi:hypothetical protein
MKNDKTPYNETQLVNDNVKMCQELLAENNLYEVYLSSRKIPFSKLNRNLLVLFTLTSLTLTLNIDSENLAKIILSVASDLISVVLTVLGFLIAGYTIFCSVMNHSLSMGLYNSETRPHGFSQLKYSHLLFIRVFFYYLIYTFFLILITFFSNVQFLNTLTSVSSVQIEYVFYVVNYIIFNILFIGVIFLLLQLASFTFNIYHSVMTSICLTEINKK